VPAFASQDGGNDGGAVAPSGFDVAGPKVAVGNGASAYSEASGTIHWYNRTAQLDFHFHPFVFLGLESRESRVSCEAFAGVTKIDTQVTTATLDGDYGPIGIGDTNLRGGIDRIKITVCDWIKESSTWSCGTSVNVSKPA